MHMAELAKATASKRCIGLLRRYAPNPTRVSPCRIVRPVLVLAISKNEGMESRIGDSVDSRENSDPAMPSSQTEK